MKDLFKLFKGPFEALLEYKALKGTEQGENSSKLGKMAISASIALLIYGAFAGLGARMLLVMDFFFLFRIVIGCVLAILGVLMFLSSLISAIMCICFQFKLNKRGIRWTALICFIICLLSAVAIAVLFVVL